MDRNKQLIEEAIDCVYHIQFKVELLGDKEVTADLESLELDRLMIAIVAELGEVPDEIVLEDLHIVFCKLTGSPVETYMFHHLAFEAGAGLMLARIKEVLNSGDFE